MRSNPFKQMNDNNVLNVVDQTIIDSWEEAVKLGEDWFDNHYRIIDDDKDTAKRHCFLMSKIFEENFNEVLTLLSLWSQKEDDEMFTQVVGKSINSYKARHIEGKNNSGIQKKTNDSKGRFCETNRIYKVTAKIRNIPRNVEIRLEGEKAILLISLNVSIRHTNAYFAATYQKLCQIYGKDRVVVLVADVIHIFNFALQKKYMSIKNDIGNEKSLIADEYSKKLLILECLIIFNFFPLRGIIPKFLFYTGELPVIFNYFLNHFQRIHFKFSDAQLVTKITHKHTLEKGAHVIDVKKQQIIVNEETKALYDSEVSSAEKQKVGGDGEQRHQRQNDQNEIFSLLPETKTLLTIVYVFIDAMKIDPSIQIMVVKQLMQVLNSFEPIREENNGSARNYIEEMFNFFNSVKKVSDSGKEEDLPLHLNKDSTKDFGC